MYRSKATMEQHKKKYTQDKNNSTHMESHMQPNGNLHLDSHRPSSFSHTLFRPPFCSTIQQNSFPSDIQSVQSIPVTYNPNLYDSMMHQSTSSSYSKPPRFDPMLHQSTSSSYSKPPRFETMLHRSTSSTYSKPLTVEPMLHPSTSTYQFSSFHLNQDDENEDEDEDEDEDADEDENDEESKEVEIVDEYGSILRVQKMTAKDVYKLTEGEKVLVHVNDSFQLIKGAAGVCTRFMTMLLSKPNLCPPEAKDWREIKKRCGTLLLGELRRKFILPQVSDVDGVLFAMFGVKVRYTKRRFKMKLFELAAKKLNEANNFGANGEQERTYTDDQLLQALDLIDIPPNFLHHQWELYKSNLRTPLAKKLSEQGKKARSMQVHTHTTGATSFARKRDRFKKKHKRSPNRIEFFDLSYQSKDGSFIHGISGDFMEKAREEMTRRELEISKSRTVDDEVRSEIADAVMMDLFGPDKPGQAFGYGTGVTKSKVTKLSLDLRRSRKESLVDQNRLLLEKVNSQGNQIKTMAKDLSDIRGELNLLKTAFKELHVAAGASKDRFFQETFEDVQEEQPHQHKHNLNNLWQRLWQSDMTPSGGVQVQNQQGQATRRPTKFDSMGQQQNGQQNQQGYSDMLQDMQGQATRRPTKFDSMEQQNLLTGQQNQKSYSDMLQDMED